MYRPWVCVSVYVKEKWFPPNWKRAKKASFRTSETPITQMIQKTFACRLHLQQCWLENLFVILDNVGIFLQFSISYKSAYMLGVLATRFWLPPNSNMTLLFCGWAGALKILYHAHLFLLHKMLQFKKRGMAFCSSSFELGLKRCPTNFRIAVCGIPRYAIRNDHPTYLLFWLCIFWKVLLDWNRTTTRNAGNHTIHLHRFALLTWFSRDFNTWRSNKSYGSGSGSCLRLSALSGWRNNPLFKGAGFLVHCPGATNISDPFTQNTTAHCSHWYYRHTIFGVFLYFEETAQSLLSELTSKSSIRLKPVQTWSLNKNSFDVTSLGLSLEISKIHMDMVSWKYWT